MAFQNTFKNFLESTNENEEDLTQKEMEELQEAINKSKESANIEQEKRQFERQAEEIQRCFYKGSTGEYSSDQVVREKPFTPKQWSKQPKCLSTLDKELESSQEELMITFQDLPDISGEPLNIIYHKPVFTLPVTLNIDYAEYTIQQRAQLLYNYYTRIDSLKSKLAKQSLQRAPYPKPILPSNKCETSLYKNGTEESNGGLDDFIEQSPPRDLYVSRAGRQIKRKIYTEDLEGDSDSDFVTSIKKNKSDDSDHIKITLDMPYVFEENLTEEKNEKAVKTRKDTPRKPITLSTKKSITRNEVLFEELIHVEEKKKQQDEEMEMFEKTLPKLEDIKESDWFMASHAIEENQDDTNFVRQRVPPPLPIKKGRARKGKQEDTDKISTKYESSPEKDNEPAKRSSNTTRKTETKTKPKLRNQKSKEESTSPKLEKRSCPICDKKFLQSEIANHASSCGIEEEVSEDDAETIKCELCDRYFPADINYEVHVRECTAAKIVDM